MQLFNHSSANLILAGLFRNPEFCLKVQQDTYPLGVALCPQERHSWCLCLAQPWELEQAPGTPAQSQLHSS